MTPEEAIEDLQYLITEYEAYPPETGVCTTIGSLQYTISSLEELQQYREIGTVEECRADREKQSPKNIEKIREGEYCCPKCYTVYDDCIFEYDYCINCGQAIRWNENLEGMEDE